jgi:hypothetical protein
VPFTQPLVDDFEELLRVEHRDYWTWPAIAGESFPPSLEVVPRVSYDARSGRPCYLYVPDTGLEGGVVFPYLPRIGPAHTELDTVVVDAWVWDQFGSGAYLQFDDGTGFWRGQHSALWRATEPGGGIVGVSRSVSSSTWHHLGITVTPDATVTWTFDGLPWHQETGLTDLDGMQALRLNWWCDPDTAPGDCALSGVTIGWTE